MFYAYKTLASKLCEIDLVVSSRQAEKLTSEHNSLILAIGYLLTRGNWNKR